MLDSDRRPASNRRPILKSLSDFYFTYICPSDLCPFSNSQIGVQFLNLWPFLTFSNRRPIFKSMTVSHFLKSTFNASTLTLINKSAIDLRIWKNADLRIPLNRTVVWDNEVSGCRFVECTSTGVRTLIWVYLW